MSQNFSLQYNWDRSVCLSRPYVCLSVRPSICYMYELLLTYCYSTDNLYEGPGKFLAIWCKKCLDVCSGTGSIQ